MLYIGAALPVRRWLVPALGLCWFAVIFANSAWLYEDAYISFRSIEQMYAGNGPVWNPGERVQVYTSVAWYWLGYVARLVTADYMLATLFWSALCCAGVLGLLRRFVADELSWLALVVVLTASRGVMEFASSGLENPLGYLLIMVFALYWRRLVMSVHPCRRSLVGLFAVAALVPLVRHDLVLLIAPACAHALWLGRKQLSTGQWVLLLCAAALPLLGWTAFSLAYYGMPLPNTYYAKAASSLGVARVELLQAGINYYFVNLFFDPVTVLGVVAGTYCLLRSRHIALGLGLLLNLCYVLWIGGDYMLTRFLTYSFVLVLACCGQQLIDGCGRQLRSWQRGALAVLLLVTVLLLLWHAVLRKAILSALFVLYRNVLQIVEVESHVVVEQLQQLSFLDILLCVLLISTLVWLPGARWLRSKGVAKVRTLNSVALAAAALGYMQFTPQLNLHLGPISNAKVFTVEQIRFVGNSSAHLGLSNWWNYRHGIMTSFEEYGHPMLNHAYLEGGRIITPETVKFPSHLWSITGSYLSRRTEKIMTSAVGMFGFAVGNDGYIFDMYGITEPYIARLKLYRGVINKSFYPGHNYRAVPSEYFSDQAGRTVWGLGDDYRQLAQDIDLAVRSTDLWAYERWRAIWRLIRNNYALPQPVNRNSVPVFVFVLGRDGSLEYVEQLSPQSTAILAPLRSVILHNRLGQNILKSSTSIRYR